MNTNISQLIDFEKVDVLLEGFNKSTGFVSAIIDLEGILYRNLDGGKYVLNFIMCMIPNCKIAESGIQQ